MLLLLKWFSTACRERSKDEDWGPNPNPQGYYDTAYSDEILQYVGTPRAGIIKNITDAMQGIDEFLQFYKP